MGKKKVEKLQEIPIGQVWFDKIFFGLAISLAITGILYTVWGLIEVLNVAPAP